MVGFFVNGGKYGGGGMFSVWGVEGKWSFCVVFVDDNVVNCGCWIVVFKFVWCFFLCVICCLYYR